MKKKYIITITLLSCACAYASEHQISKVGATQDSHAQTQTSGPTASRARAVVLNIERRKCIDQETATHAAATSEHLDEPTTPHSPSLPATHAATASSSENAVKHSPKHVSFNLQSEINQDIAKGTIKVVEATIEAIPVIGKLADEAEHSKEGKKIEKLVERDIEKVENAGENDLLMFFKSLGRKCACISDDAKK